MARHIRPILSFIALATLWSCARAPEPVPEQPRPAPPRPAPVRPVPPVPAVTIAWPDRPLTPGDWVYRRDNRGSLALFGPAGDAAHFVIRCDTAKRRIYLSRAGNFAGGDTGRMTIRTTTALQAYAVANSNEDPPFAAADLAPTDPHLDAMAYSRGRFAIIVKGAPDLIIPAWPEFSRVVEDCR